MNIKKLGKLEQKVCQVLIEKPETRKDDFLLIKEVLNKFVDVSISLDDLFVNHKKLGLPPLESITRCRRKIQAKHKELADDVIREGRNGQQEIYIEYANERGII